MKKLILLALPILLLACGSPSTSSEDASVESDSSDLVLGGIACQEMVYHWMNKSNEYHCTGIAFECAGNMSRWCDRSSVDYCIRLLNAGMTSCDFIDNWPTNCSTLYCE